ncbi:glycosyl transferase [Chishuiella changwenlii]|uniref:Glycosyl transferase n=1 Tax=Chishuiella changwenlii TaxID=1434701 RepID=A0ABQ1U7I6_9FLAO|nr:glycosyltransferase family A protein [Chishuiella changwenlii]GGF11606.1 glycosyl transferase [Chishuiella changwenlii]
MKNAPLVSIIVPCYNQSEYLDECLQSVLDQTYQNWECIIINDGSQDDTEKIAQTWVDKDHRFKYLFQENSGVANARNYAIENSSGDWILPLDGDDKISLTYLEKASEHFKQDIKLIYGKAELFDYENGPFVLREYSFDNILASNIIYVSAFYKRADYDKGVKYDSYLKKGLEDWDFWISLLEKNDKVIYIQDTVFYYRIKKDSRNVEIHNNSILKNEYENYILNKHKVKYLKEFGTYFELLEKLQKTKSLNKNFEKFFISKRFKIMSFFTSFFDKFKK